jgi:SRSO17 transposase
MHAPSPDAALLDQLRNYVLEFSQDFSRAGQARWAEVYLEGLLLGRERRNAEALARRLRRPGKHPVSDAAQALQHFLNQSPWDEQRLLRRYRAWMAARSADDSGVIVVSDTVFHKRGGNSVGVHRQVDHSTGKKTNCQIGVTLHRVGQHMDFPLALRLYLPRRWLNSANQLETAAVPEEYRLPASKVQIALDLLDALRREGQSIRTIVADGAYGGASAFRDGLAERRLSYLVEADPSTAMAEVLERTESTKASSVEVLTLFDLAHRQAHAWNWEGAKGTLSLFAWTRVFPMSAKGSADHRDSLGLLVEWRPDRSFSFALSNLPASTPRTEAIRLRQARGRRERLLAQLRSLGLDHFEGRSWRGFHHHVCLVMLAFGLWITARPTQ